MSDDQETRVFDRPSAPAPLTGASAAGPRPAPAPAPASTPAGSRPVPAAAPADDPTVVRPRKAPADAPRRDPRPAPLPGTGPARDRTGRVKQTGTSVRPARKARLRIAKLDPWSVMKTALMFSIAAAVILFVAVALLWSVIEASGALVTLQEALNALLGNPDGSGQIQVSAFVDRWRVLGFTAIVCGVNVILLTALVTLGAFLYNLSSSVLGGLEVTLAED